MAKTSIIERELKRTNLEKKHSKRRKALKARSRDLKLSSEERFKAMLELQRLPRNANPTRQRTRCAITGRPRGVYRKFGLARNMLRIHAMRGDIPGLVKSSW